MRVVLVLVDFREMTMKELWQFFLWSLICSIAGFFIWQSIGRVVDQWILGKSLKRYAQDGARNPAKSGVAK